MIAIAMAVLSVIVSKVVIKKVGLAVIKLIHVLSAKMLYLGAPESFGDFRPHKAKRRRPPKSFSFTI